MSDVSWLWSSGAFPSAAAGEIPALLGPGMKQFWLQRARNLAGKVIKPCQENTGLGSLLQGSSSVDGTSAPTSVNPFCPIREPSTVFSCLQALCRCSWVSPHVPRWVLGQSGSCCWGSLGSNPSPHLYLSTDYAISKPGVLSQIEQGEESRVRNEQDLEESEIITDATAGERAA